MNGLSYGFQRMLDHIRSIADSEAHKGRLVERLMKTYFTADPHYKVRFSEVWLWSEWVRHMPGFKGTDKGLPRIPFAPDFRAFAEAGRELTRIHLGYETCEEYALELICNQSGEPRPEYFRIGTRKMRLVGPEKTEIIVNEHIRLQGIPADAHRYEVNGRTPIEWFIDRYHIKRDKRSGLVNDPNGWFEHPRDLISAIRRIVQVSVETVRIVGDLPEPMAGEPDVQ